MCENVKNGRKKMWKIKINQINWIRFLVYIDVGVVYMLVDEMNECDY